MIETEPSHTDLYELYVLNSENKLTFYGNHEVKSEDIYCREINGNIITIYQTTGGTRIIFASNGITIIHPQDYKESFTQGYMHKVQ